MPVNKKAPVRGRGSNGTMAKTKRKAKANQRQGNNNSQGRSGNFEQQSSKTPAQIDREARKRQRRKERVAAAKEEHRRRAEERWAAGERPWKPCHLCREEGHWARDCPKYGAWKAKMDAKKG